jgi:hypothetical protein
MTDVHTEHCCIVHGCKYMDDDCTVITRQLPQSYSCEQCWWSEDINSLKELKQRYPEAFGIPTEPDYQI